MANLLSRISRSTLLAIALEAAVIMVAVAVVIVLTA